MKATIRGFAASLTALVAVATGSASAGAEPGDLDRSFGRDGKVARMLASEASVQAVVVQDDGKVIVAGSSHPLEGGPGRSNRDGFMVARFRRNGRLDRSFARDGVKEFMPFTGANYLEGGVDGVAIAPDGKIVAAGSATDFDMWDEELFGATQVVRLRPSGRFDRSFGDRGFASPEFSEGVEFNPDLSIDSNGEITLAGTWVDGIWTGSSYETRDCWAARLTDQGEPDPNFGTGGATRVDFGGDDEDCYSLAATGDGIVIGGGMGGKTILAKLDGAGELVPAFGAAGRTVTDCPEAALDLVTLPSGAFVAASAAAEEFTVCGFTPTGELDPAFAGGGVQVVDFGGDSASASALVEAGGRVLVAGTAKNRNLDWAVTRLLGSGELDTSFAGDGMRTVDFFGRRDFANSISLAPRSRVVVAGNVRHKRTAKPAAARIKR